MEASELRSGFGLNELLGGACVGPQALAFAMRACHRMRLAATSQGLAMNETDRIKGGVSDDDQNDWFSCVLFSGLRQDSTEQGGGLLACGTMPSSVFFPTKATPNT